MGSAALSHCSVKLLFWADTRGSEARLQVLIARIAGGERTAEQLGPGSSTELSGPVSLRVGVGLLKVFSWV